MNAPLTAGQRPLGRVDGAEAAGGEEALCRWRKEIRGEGVV